LFMGACFQVLEYLMWQFGVVGYIGKVSICVLVVCSNTCASSWGFVRLLWGWFGYVYILLI
jgi:hypothetical protein